MQICLRSQVRTGTWGHRGATATPDQHRVHRCQPPHDGAAQSFCPRKSVQQVIRHSSKEVHGVTELRNVQPLCFKFTSGIKDCDEGCDHYLTFNPFTLTDPHTQHYPLTQIQQENKYTLTVHTMTQTHTNPTCMHTNGCSYTPTPHGPCATQSFPHYSSAICHFPHFPLSSRHISLARYWPSTLTHAHTWSSRWVPWLSDTNQQWIPSRIMETINPAAERLYTANLHSDTYKHMGFHFKIPNASFGINLAMLNCCACVYGYSTVQKSSAPTSLYFARKMCSNALICESINGNAASKHSIEIQSQLLV